MIRTDTDGRSRITTKRLMTACLVFGVALLVAISMVNHSGTPDPTDAPAPSMLTAVVNSGVIVFREGLEAVLIFAAITASFLGARQKYRRPMAIGAALAFGAAVVTWVVLQDILHSFGSASADVLQAVTGMIAIAVLLLVMNWFFHKVYWTEHIAKKNAKRRELVSESEADGKDVQFWGFVLLGFTSVYREGFEVVLFLQNLQLKSGSTAVFWGVLLGLVGTGIVGFLTFALHHKLPYKKMLVLTGVLLGVVLVVMTGGTARTLVDIHWLPGTRLGMTFPDWWARWFELVPLVWPIVLQLVAAVFVIGSYYAAEWWVKEQRRRKQVARQALERQAEAARPAVAGTPRVDRPAVPAAVRGAAYAAEPALVPTTLCGHPATTLCGCDASVAIAPAQVAAAVLVPGSALAAAAPNARVAASAAVAPVAPSLAPAFTPAPAFPQAPLFPPASARPRLDERPAMFSGRAPMFGDRPPVLAPAAPASVTEHDA